MSDSTSDARRTLKELFNGHEGKTDQELSLEMEAAGSVLMRQLL